MRQAATVSRTLRASPRRVLYWLQPRPGQPDHPPDGDVMDDEIDDEMKLVLALGAQARAEQEGMDPEVQQLGRDLLGPQVDRYHAATAGVHRTDVPE
jgi:hypothetical protein